MFNYCESLTSVTIPNRVTSVGLGEFSGCRKLTNVTIPNSVTSIGKFAFASCRSLTSVMIPNRVTSIGDKAFPGCTSLSSIYCQGNAPRLDGSDVFKDCINPTVYYLDGTTGWGPTFGGFPTVLWTSSAPIAPVIPSKVAQPQVKMETPRSRDAASAERGRPVTNTKSMPVIGPDKSDKSDLGKSSKDGSDYKLLVGTWTAASGSDSSQENTFEFKNNKIVIHTFSYRTTDGGSGKHSDEWKASIKKDKIILERTQNVRYASSYKQWYEISLPFDPDNLVITRYHEGQGSSDNTTYQLNKQTEESKQEKKRK